MKKCLRYFGVVTALGLMFTLCYYVSYRSALRRLEGQEQKQGINQLFDERQQQAEEMFTNLSGPAAQTELPKQEEAGINIDGEMEMAGDKEDSATEASVAKEPVISPETKLVVETLEINTGDFSTRQMLPEKEIIGMNREAYLAYLSEKLQKDMASEKDSGLYATELIRFSDNKIVVRNSYDLDRLKYKYYLAIKNDEIVVYYSDRKTVFEYTGISAIQLPEDVRLALLNGIKVKTMEELFALLESYSS